MLERARHPYYLQFVDRSFRDMADGDYVAARSLHRCGLYPQFLWSAHQALEKYLKATLLYSHTSAKGLSHDLQRAVARVRGISDMSIQLPEDVVSFLRYLNQQGPNRYFEWGTYTLGRELLQLDRTVWFVRRYCRWLRGAWPGDSAFLRAELERLEAVPVTDACRLRIPGGYLEQILEGRNEVLRRQLVWKNLWYGRRVRRAVRYRPTGLRAANPTHIIQPELMPYLMTLVDFSKPIRDHFANTRGNE